MRTKLINFDGSVRLECEIDPAHMLVTLNGRIYLRNWEGNYCEKKLYVIRNFTVDSVDSVD